MLASSSLPATTLSSTCKADVSASLTDCTRVVTPNTAYTEQDCTNDTTLACYMACYILIT